MIIFNIISKNAPSQKPVRVCKFHKIGSQKDVKSRESKEGVRNTKLPDVVKTAYGPNGGLQDAAENVIL